MNFSEKEFLDSAFYDAAIGMGVVSLDLRYLKVNRRFAEITGYSERELETMTVADITHPEDMQENVENDKKVTKSDAEKRSFQMEKRYLRKDGSIVWVALTVTAIIDDSGKPKFFVSQVADINDRVKLQKDLEESQKKVKAKSDFIAHLSHEIRNPLGAIIGLSEFALETDETEDKIYIEKKILSTAITLNEILDNTLDFFKIGESKAELSISSFPLLSLVEDVFETLSINIKSRDNQYEILQEGLIPDAIQSDRTKIKQILINLISNANKYTDGGMIRVRIKYGPSIECFVEDSGCGIPLDSQDKIFDSYQQIPGVSTGGTGLGLAIVTEFSKIVGDGIRLESSSPQGSIFAFSIFDHKIEYRSCG